MRVLDLVTDKKSLWNRAQLGKKLSEFKNVDCDLFQYYWMGLWPIPKLTIWTVTYSNDTKINCDLFQWYQNQLWPIPMLPKLTVTYSNVTKLNCDLFQCYQIKFWPIPMSQNQNVTNYINTKSNCDNFTIDKGGIHLVHTQFLAFLPLSLPLYAIWRHCYYKLAFF